MLRVHASNMVVRSDPNGNLAPDKSKVTEKIDGIVALIMGTGAALVNRHVDPLFQMMFFKSK